MARLACACGAWSSDDEIAQALLAVRSAGGSRGSSSGTAFTIDGEPRVMRFSRPTQVPVWVSYQRTRLGDYVGDVGDEAFKKTVASRLDVQLQPGATIDGYTIIDAAHRLGVKVRSFAFGLAAAPTRGA